MVFYSISDVTDKLLATSGSLAPALQENFWVNNIQLEHTDPLREVLDDLSPSAMAAFDLACTQCHLWKTCKQLLETAERRLYHSLENQGRLLIFVFINLGLGAENGSLNVVCANTWVLTKPHSVVFMLFSPFSTSNFYFVPFCTITFPGHHPDFVSLYSEGVKGFPAVLQQISKILNYSCASQGQSKPGSILCW